MLPPAKVILSESPIPNEMLPRATANLSEGAIAILSTPDHPQLKSPNFMPVLQVTDVRLMTPRQSSSNSNSNCSERYRLVLSDGLRSHHSMLATDRNDLVRSQRLQKGSIVQLNEFVSNIVQSRTIIIIIDLDIIETIGNKHPIFAPQSSPLHKSPCESSKNIVKEMLPPATMNLSEGAIAILSNPDHPRNEDPSFKPVLEVSDDRLINAQSQIRTDSKTVERYRLI